jgi:hypothetical protein
VCPSLQWVTQQISLVQVDGLMGDIEGRVAEIGHAQRVCKTCEMPFARPFPDMEVDLSTVISMTKCLSMLIFPSSILFTSPLYPACCNYIHHMKQRAALIS